MPGTVSTIHKSGCVGPYALGIPPAPVGERLVLTGFLFEAGGEILSTTKTSNDHWRIQHRWLELIGSTSPMPKHGFRVEDVDGIARPINRLHVVLVTDTATVYFTDAEYDESFTGSTDVIPTMY